MNIVMITTLMRTKLLEQSLKSMFEGAVEPNQLHLTLVCDSGVRFDSVRYDTLIVNQFSIGASASRNIGASSIPKYKRQKHVCFLDDDVYMCPGWDKKIEAALDWLHKCAISGHAHPFNQSSNKYQNGKVGVESAGVLSTVNIACSWEMWDDVGYFIEPGGPGGSEDVEWCKRAVDKGYGLAVTDPQCIIHTGLASSSGKDIIGRDLFEVADRIMEVELGQ